ncbi:hypothetical protein RHMOL_Rhmol04G0116200 [Rhododendron molle]|uniref:Uncharacterized protein n=1 Tax=Rhododendron molle TaxID=49168 RepID=A0ACC0P0F3_RHOML|nr:hypothetical protein RHMOL_Rhmol04G0116200 [Rhododendron molle]
MASTTKKILFFTPPPVFLSPPNFLRHAPETTFCGLLLRRNCSKVRISLTGLFVMPFSSSSHLLRYFSLRRTPETTFRGLPTSSGKVYGSLARAGKDFSKLNRDASRILYVSGHTLESSLQPENVFLSSRGSLKQMILRSWILFHSSSLLPAIHQLI